MPTLIHRSADDISNDSQLSSSLWRARWEKRRRRSLVKSLTFCGVLAVIRVCPLLRKPFHRTTFARLLQNAPLVGELGLDGASSVPMTLQRNNLRAALQELSSQPRLVSLHSHRAHMPLLDELEQNPARGVILHWWLGSPSETRRAISLGCYFSVNAAMLAP